MSEGFVRRQGVQFYLAIFILLVVAAIGYLVWTRTNTPEQTDLRVSVPPFVDTAFTKVGLAKNAFGTLSPRVKLVDTNWENQYDVLAGGGIDIAMSTVDEFVNKSRNLAAAGKPVVFILPAWKFRGLGFYAAKDIRPLSEFSGRDAKDEFLGQLRDKKIVLAEGSVFDQALRAFVKGSSISYDDLTVVNASLDSALNSLSDSSVGIVAVGSQQRFEAERRGYREAISPEALGLDVITGFIVSEGTYRERRSDVISFACGWYATAKIVTADRRSAYDITNSYLVGRGANSLTFEEYSALRAFNVLPTSPAEANELFIAQEGAAYWKSVWERSVTAMKEAGKVDGSPLNTKGFVAPDVLAAAQSSCP